MFWAADKTADAKLAMYQSIVQRLGTILISVEETAAGNWSFGNGKAGSSGFPPR